MSAQELSLEEVVPTCSSSGMLDDGKLDLVMVTVPETATVEVLTVQTESSVTVLATTSFLCRGAVAVFPEGSLIVAHPETCVALLSCFATKRGRKGRQTKEGSSLTRPCTCRQTPYKIPFSLPS